jgi:CubicO group peptidase (beta-lactamase class C family)
LNLKPIIRQFSIWLSVAGLMLIFASQPQAQAAFPGADWETVQDPAALGWSAAKLEVVEQYAQTLGSGALMIVSDGKVVFSWGEATTPFPVYGIVDSIMSALYGIGVHNGSIDILQTLADLNIDDYKPLTDKEKQATIKNLLQGRSGVYLPASYEFAGTWRPRAPRDSDVPGGAWQYNVWGVNALATIFEASTAVKPFEAFQQWIAEPVGMQDYRPGDGTLIYGPTSEHPTYRFRLSARDLARFGHLFLRQGQWQESQVVPATWVTESVRPQATTGRLGLQSGYGYLWWVAAENERYADLGFENGTYTASGVGQRLVVLPHLNTVVVHLTPPSDPSGLIFTDNTLDRLLSLILEARLDADPAEQGLTGKLETPRIPAPSLEGNLLGVSPQQPISIYLPPGYEMETAKRFPTVYLLPSYRETIFELLLAIDEEGKATTLPAYRGVKIRALLDRLILSGKIPEMIVVMPNTHNVYYGSFYANSSVAGRWEDFISSDLVSYVDANYRTYPDAGGRGIAGHGMGGFGALRLSMKHPDIFSAVYGMSPFGLSWEKDLGEKNPLWRRALLLSAPGQLDQAWRQGDVHTGVFTALAAAFSPNPNLPPLYVDWPLQVNQKENSTKPEVRVSNKSHGDQRASISKSNELVPNPPAHQKWEREFPVNMIPRYRDNLSKLTSISIDFGTQDMPANVPAGTQAFSRTLAENGIPHELKIYAGRSGQNMRERLIDHLLPFFARTLNFVER